MSKRAFFKRYLWLFDVIKRNRYITFKELAHKFENSDFRDDDQAGFSKRTFIRDKDEILELFGVEIKYSATERGYYVVEENSSPIKDLTLDSYRLINTYQMFEDADRYIAAEQNKSGSEHLLTVLAAIQNRKKLKFDYCKYVNESPLNRIIEPYFIKQFKNRWYVIARDTKDLQIKAFALERIVKDIDTINPSASFDIPQNIKPDTYFKDSFGIFKLSDAKTEEIELSFKPLKGKFIKSQPLHASQTIIIDTDNELRVKLKLQITHDFIMELLSHGSEVKVIAPKSLRNMVIEEYKNTLSQYR